MRQIELYGSIAFACKSERIEINLDERRNWRKNDIFQSVVERFPNCQLILPTCQLVVDSTIVDDGEIIELEHNPSLAIISKVCGG
ncbi:hypothetical protein SNEBB_000222 [Seison nebaliae]|nr:hypothetical protein SNEBB_000222 [Seison nebaliae]